MMPPMTSRPTTSSSVATTLPPASNLFSIAFVEWHCGVFLAERLEVVLVVEVLHLQREPFGDRTTSTKPARLPTVPFLVWLLQAMAPQFGQ